MTTESIPPDGPKNRTEGSSNPRTIRSADLFVGQKVVVIEHDGTQYRLLITRNNRLILHK